MWVSIESQTALSQISTAAMMAMAMAMAKAQQRETGSMADGIKMAVSGKAKQGDREASANGIEWQSMHVVAIGFRKWSSGRQKLAFGGSWDQALVAARQDGNGHGNGCGEKSTRCRNATRMARKQD